MIDDIRLILDYDEAERDLFRQAVHRLFSTSFILRGIQEDKALYSFVVRNRDAVEAYCECAGWILRVDETLGVVSWKGPSPARLLLSKDDTILLVIARLLYEEKRNELSLLDFPVSTVGDIMEKYRALTGDQMKKTRLTDVLRRLTRLKLIRPLKGEFIGDTQVVLYPSLAMALDSTAVQELYEKIAADTGQAAGLDDESGEETDDDQAE
jgi:hypothetical protein